MSNCTWWSDCWAGPVEVPLIVVLIIIYYRFRLEGLPFLIILSTEGIYSFKKTVIFVDESLIRE